ncbi:NMDA receptor-regulated protein 1a [Gymnopilus junonius]|uniref:NMDA receptor-regulated protein 1a n=1 Tax=Gymnopilus junonius TaxID=109634 RepID=A0A9P5NPS0_GYMJU|nr:NMDA receptor-regulated protein 1a [Gymnopilus junonius]
MKGLVLTHMSRREEGIELVKKGVRLDLTSHICWHVFGLIQKADKNYEEALKSYTQALRFDKENMNLLRDSAQLQTHLRLFDNLVDTRHTILKLRPNQRQNWIALAVAHHLNGNPKEAKMVLEHYQYSLKNVPDYDYEHSETLLYYISVLEELGELSEALSILDTSAKSRAIVDRTAILEIRARILSTQNAPEADEAWRALIEHNPDNHASYLGYLSHLGISTTSPSSSPEALSKLAEFVTLLPRATAPRRLQLTLSSGDEFKALIKPYIVQNLTKGVPSLFADLKSLYVDDEKRQIIQDLLHLCRGRTLKRVGDYLGAARAVNEARLLDGQDRFLNTKCGKYLLRAGMVEEANKMFGMFTKKDAPSPASDLEDMQSLLFLLEEAAAYARLGKPNMALKRYMAVKKVFEEIEDDQFDFHGYNLRKFTVGIYLKLLSWEIQLRSQPEYIKAAVEASKIFVSVSDNPSLVTALSSTSQLTDAEKKAKKKAKKAAAASKAQEDKKAQPNVHDRADLEPAPPKDEDPDGLKLLAAPDGLEQAAKLLHPLTTLEGEGAKHVDVEAWVVVYDVAIRRKKLLQALGALNRAASLDPTHPSFHIRLVDLKLRLASFPHAPPAPIGDVFAESLSKLLPEELREDGVSLETFNSQYLQRWGGDAKKVLAAARVMRMLDSVPLENVEETVFGIFGEGVDVDVPTALSALDFLTSLSSSRVDEFRGKCQAKFELSTAFKVPAELAKLKEQVLASEVGDAVDVSIQGQGQA